MSEPLPAAGGASAGVQLRAARERQGLHVAALAAAIKIPQRKLEALEADRYDELPDATFTRALAMTVCRALKIDPVPVLAQLPQGGPRGLAKVNGSLNTPFRERGGRAEPAGRSLLSHPLSWAALAALLAALALVLLPEDWRPKWPSDTVGSDGAVSVTLPDAAASAALSMPANAPAAEAVASGVAASGVEAVPEAPAPEPAASAAAEAPAAIAVLSATSASWVEVIDAGGQVLVQRVLQPGESLGLDGRLPFRLKIGNAAATRLPVP